MKEKRHFYVTFEGKPVFGFWFGKTSGGGGLIGPTDDKSGSHITLLSKNREISSHLTEPPNHRTHMASANVDELFAKLQKELKGVEVSYHGNKKCLVLDPALWEKLNSLQAKDDGESDIYLPLDQWITELLPVFQGKDLIQKVRVKFLTAPEPPFAIMETNRGVFEPVVVSQARVLAISRPSKIIERTSKKLWLNYVLKHFEHGLNNFLKREDGKRFLSETKARLHEGGKE